MQTLSADVQGMLMNYVIRFLAGGLVVSLFAVAGDVLRPKSFAGLFGAAPSVALTTLALAFWREGGAYVATESRSMIVGAIALAAYSFLVCKLLMCMRCSALPATLVATAAWLVVAIGPKHVFLG
jgi:mannitol-specific phosphotransferase system IIBC component